MKAVSLELLEDNLDDSFNQIESISPNLIAVFYATEVAEKPVLLNKVKERFSDAIVVGCSTAGEILNDKVLDNSVSVVAMKFEKTKLKLSYQDIAEAENTYDVAKSIGDELNADDLSAILVLSPGLNVNGSDVARGLEHSTRQDVTIFGGLAGDGTNFGQTYTYADGKNSRKALVAVGFYGDAVEVKTGSKGGWSPFGPSRRVTKSKMNILYELDGKPALDLYKEYLGDKAEGLPSSGLLYPFAVLDENHSEIGLIRTILDVNHEDKSLVLAGNIDEGSLVGLMHADVDELICGAENAAKEASLNKDDDTAAFLVSCVGRKIVMADDIEEEVEAVRDILGEKTQISGFYSYGEISPFSQTSKTELHNQTMTIAHISEK